MVPEKLFSTLRLTYSLNGDNYSGEFERDLENGKGMKIFQTNTLIEKYDGQWRLGTMHGRGKMTM